MDETFDKKFFAKRLKEIRKGKKLTQDEVCDKSNIDISNYSKIETGKILPSLNSFYKIVKGLDVDANEFFEFNHLQEENLLDERIRKIYHNYSLKEKQLLYKLMRSIEDYR